MKNEPVAWMHKPSGTVFNEIIACVEPDDLIPLYTHPAKTLTDEEIGEIYWELYCDDWTEEDIKFARAILREAQEK